MLSPRPRSLALALPWLLTALAGCGSATPPARNEPAKSSGGEPAPKQGFDLAAAFGQEQEPQPLHDIATDNGQLRARIEASAAPTVSVEEGYVAITAPNGPSAVQCFVYPERKDTAEVLRVLSDSTLGEAAPEHRWVDVHGDQTNGWGYMIARAHYVVESERGKLGGDFKIASTARRSTSVACVYDAPGHYASFERVLRSLLDSLETAQDRALEPPLESEIVRSRLTGRMVSLSTAEERQERGARVVEKFEASIALGPEGSLSASDGASTATYRKGRLESATYAQAKHGAVDYALELTATKDVYKVTGTLQDKPFEAEFTVPGGLPDGERVDRLACDVREGKTPSVDLVDYVPDADPSAPTPIRFEKSEDPASHIRLSLGKAQSLTMDVVVDADCEVEKGVLRAGEAAIEIERLWRQTRGEAEKKAR